MIQDIAPHRLDNAFAVKEAKPENFFFTFHKGKVLLQKENEEREMLPRLSQLPGSFETWKEKAVYAFSVDEEPMFLILENDFQQEIPDDMEYTDLRELYQSRLRWAALVPGAPILWMLRKQYGIFRSGTSYDLPGLREYSVPENFSGDYGGSDFRRPAASNQVRRPRV